MWSIGGRRPAMLHMNVHDVCDVQIRTGSGGLEVFKILEEEMFGHFEIRPCQDSSLEQGRRRSR